MSFVIIQLILIISLLKEYKTEVQDNYRTTFINGKKFIMPAALEKHILSRFPSAQKFPFHPTTNPSSYNNKVTIPNLNLLPFNYQRITNNQMPSQSDNLLQSAVQPPSILHSPIKVQPPNIIQPFNVIPSNNLLQSESFIQPDDSIISNNNMYTKYNIQNSNLNNKLNTLNKIQMLKPLLTDLTSDQIIKNAKIELEKMKKNSLLLTKDKKFVSVPQKMIEYNIKKNFNNKKGNYKLRKKQKLTTKNNYIRSTSEEKLKKNDIPQEYLDSIFNLVNQPNLVPLGKSYKKESIANKLPFDLTDTNQNQNNKKTVIETITKPVSKIENTKKTKTANTNTLQITSEPNIIKIETPIIEPILLEIATTKTLPFSSSINSQQENHEIDTVLEKKKKLLPKKKKTKNESKKILLPNKIKNSQNYRNESFTELSPSTVMRCQDPKTKKLIPQATACKNSRSDRICSYLFKPIEKLTGKRDPKCNLKGLEDIAETCRKTCGICCEDINYACEDDTNGLIDCSKQLDKCHKPKWLGVLSQFCAGSCGLCARTACRDYDNTCRLQKDFCLKQEMMDYMRQNCARTCGFCLVSDLIDHENGNKARLISSSSGAQKVVTSDFANRIRNIQSHRFIERSPKMGGGMITIEVGKSKISPECVDREENCSENLCTDPIYGEFMLKFCTQTCLKCQPKINNNLNTINETETNNNLRLATDALRLRRLKQTKLLNSESLNKINNKQLKSDFLNLINLNQTTNLNQFNDITKSPIPSILQENNTFQSSPLNQIAKSNNSPLKYRIKHCIDRHSKCAQWKMNGFCDNDKKFTIEDRIRLCPKSCKLCESKKSLETFLNIF